MSWDIDGFRQKLEKQHKFPGKYLFKFIVPIHAIVEVENLAQKVPVRERPSRKGNYSSVTFEMSVKDAKEVIDIYQRAFKIEGCIAL